MNWQMRTAIGTAFAVVIVVVVYFKGALWQILTANADAITAIAAVLAALAGTVAGVITILVYRSNKKANIYRYFADLYYEILRRGLDHPEFLDPKKTRKYKEVFNREKRIQYNNYARMCWAHAFDIYDVSDFKDYFIRLYSPTFERYNGLHGVWLLDNTSTFSLDFVEFVKLNGWRDYLDEREADRLRWSNVVEDYDETILNPFLLKDKYLYKYLYKYLFSWSNVPGNDNEKLKKCLRDNFDIDWVKDAKITKSTDGMTIKISTENKRRLYFIYDENSAKIIMDNEKEGAKLEISDGRIHDLKVKMEDSKLNIYKHNNPLFHYINEYLNEEEHKGDFEKTPKTSENTTKVYREETITRSKSKSSKVVADLGCGNGKLIEILSNKFEKVYGIDYSDNMLEMAKKRCNSFNVSYKKMDLTNLEEEIYGKIDIAFSINSILPRNPKDTPIILDEIYKAVKLGGLFIAILPSFDTVLYLKKLWYKRRIEHLKERYNKHSIKKLGCKWEARMDTRRKFHKHLKLNERKHLYADDGSNVQRFIHENEIEGLLKKAGFELKQMEKVTYPWELCKKYNYEYFPEKKEIWDWFVVAKKSEK